MFFLKNLLKFGGGAAAKKFQDTEKPFLDHLEDLRGTLFKILGTVIISTLLAFIFNKQLISVIQHPLSAGGIDTVGDAFGPVEGFMGVLKICLYAGLIASFPLILYFIGEFVIPGLNDKEKKLIIPVVIASFLLFATGVLFAYFVVIPRALQFFIEFGEARNIGMDLRFRYAVSFVTMLCLVFGLCFELPVVVMTLVKLDLLNSTMMRGTRSYAIVAMFIVAAIVTPTPDIFTMSLLAGPMILLYEICIWLAWGMERRAAKAEAREKAREHKVLVERQKREKQRREAGEAEETKVARDGDAATQKAAAGTLTYDPDNAAVFDDDEHDPPESGEDQSSDVADDAEPEYHSGLDDAGSATIDPTSDAVWGYTPGATDSDHGEDPNGHGDTDHDSGHSDYDADHYDHSYHDHDYYSGPTDELKRMLRDELKEDLKDELKESIKAELKAEILAELREELNGEKGDE